MRCPPKRRQTCSTQLTRFNRSRLLLAHSKASKADLARTIPSSLNPLGDAPSPALILARDWSESKGAIVPRSIKVNPIIGARSTDTKATVSAGFASQLVKLIRSLTEALRENDVKSVPTISIERSRSTSLIGSIAALVRASTAIELSGSNSRMASIRSPT